MITQSLISDGVLCEIISMIAERLKAFAFPIRVRRFGKCKRCKEDHPTTGIKYFVPLS